MNYGVTPDIVTTAKGLAGGLPLGATMFGERAADIYTPGSHGSTFGGNPICAAGAVNVLSRIDDDLLAGVVRRSEIIRSHLAGKPGIVSISGMGLMLGIETVKSAADVITYCREHGVLVLSAKNRVRLLPALNIPEDLLLRALEVVAASAASDPAGIAGAAAMPDKRNRRAAGIFKIQRNISQKIKSARLRMSPIYSDADRSRALFFVYG